MPRKDGTGPMGNKLIIGRGVGFCTGFISPNYEKTTRYSTGIGFGYGFKRVLNTTRLPKYGRCCSTAYTRTSVTADSEKELLNKQVTFLKNQLQQLKKRISSFDENTQ